MQTEISAGQGSEGGHRGRDSRGCWLFLRRQGKAGEVGVAKPSLETLQVVWEAPEGLI